MNPEPPASDLVAALVKLYIARPARIDLRGVPVAFGPDADWLGECLSEEPSGMRRYACDLELQVGPDRRATFRKSAIVGLGALARVDDAWVVPVEWHAATLAPLFPVFVGHLRLRTERVELDGWYTPPGGKIGYVLDRALLHIAARGTGRWFLHKVEAVLGGT